MLKRDVTNAVMPFAVTVSVLNMSIVTKTGDDGQSRFLGKVVSKDSALLGCVGTIDELQAFLGLLKLQTSPHTLILNQIQTSLWSISGELVYQTPYLNIDNDLKELENYISKNEKLLPKLTRFIIPGINQSEALAHVCRTIARRAERHLVALHQTNPVNPKFLKYLNRLSDLLFIIARLSAALSP